MDKNKSLFRTILSIAAIGLLCSTASAWTHSGGSTSGGHSGGYSRGSSGASHSWGGHSYGGHYYRGGGFYGYYRSPYLYDAWPYPYYYYNDYDYSPDYAVAAPAPVVEVVEQAPPPVEYGSATPQQGNFVRPQPAGSDTVIIGVPGSRGDFTPVKLVKHKDGYVGPQGEFYAGHPTIAQLKALYGG